MSTLSGYSCNIHASGDAEFFREVAAPFACAMAEALPYRKEDIPESLKIRDRGAHNAFGSALLIGVTIIGGAVVKKVWDDVYAVLIQPRVKPLLEKFDSKLKNRAEKKSFNLSIWYKDINALVSVTITGNSFADIQKQLDLVPTVHAGAITWIAANGCSKPVLHYKIEDGKVNAAPILADNFEELHR